MARDLNSYSLEKLFIFKKWPVTRADANATRKPDLKFNLESAPLPSTSSWKTVLMLIN